MIPKKLWVASENLVLSLGDDHDTIFKKEGNEP